MPINKNQKFRNLIQEVLSGYEKIWYDTDQTDTSTQLNKTLFLELIEKVDPTLIRLLFSNENIKEKFFVKINEAYVFKAKEFYSFIENREIDHSYTSYKNRIGLIGNKNFLQDIHHIVLGFPYKDCVLEGGQSTEEHHTKTSGKREVFFHEVIEHDKIEYLQEPKAFINWKYYSHSGISDVDKITRDMDSMIRENLIIKGNNLIALYSLQQQFYKSIKLIYIDPPYNTGNDSFQYNDNFSHATWLTFMKNRLEIARELLRDDGVIMVSIDENEQAYLKVLMDEIFGRNNFITNFIWQTKRGAQGMITKTKVVINHENILVYGKDKQYFSYVGLPRTAEHFSNPDNDPRGPWKRQYLQRLGQDLPKRKIVNPSNGMVFVFETPYREEKMTQWVKENRIIFPNDKDKYPIRKEYFAEYKHKQQITSFIGLFPTKKSTEELYELFEGVKIFRNPKPEALLKFLIEQSTEPGDIILDYHLGSGTTASVAHKMRRQYIGIEQMDYIQNITCKRLHKVINGEQLGISLSVDWQGGGNFIYCELAKFNEQAKEDIIACNDLPALEKVFTMLCTKYLIDYHFKVKEFQEVRKEKAFRNLPLKQQKDIFLSMLDLNHMYTNKTEMADSIFNINLKDQKLTEDFYKQRVIA